MSTAYAPDTLRLPSPIGLQPTWLNSRSSRKVVRVGRRGSKTRFAMLAAITGHGEGAPETPEFGGILSGGDVLWVAVDYPQLTTVLWREEIVPRFQDLSYATLNGQDHTLSLAGLGTLFLRSSEALRGVRGMGKNLKGVVIDEAAHFDLEGALLNEVLPTLLDNGGWLILMSTTNAGPDGNSEKRMPSFFNLICEGIRSGDPRFTGWEEFYGTAFDNPRINDAGIHELIGLYPAGSPALEQEVYARLLVGGIGLALPELSAAKHIVPRFPIPDYWTHFGAFDWGYNHPWCFGWYTVDTDGNVFKVDTIWGREDLPVTIANTVKAAVPMDKLRYVHAGHDCWADRKARGENVPTVAEQLMQAGWKRMEKANISRVSGLNNFRSYVHWQATDTEPEREPRFKLMDTEGNRRCLAQLQTMQVDPKNLEDALKMDAGAGKGGDDSYDECLAGDTLVLTDRGYVTIGQMVGTEGSVLTPVGWQRYNAVRCTREHAPVFRVALTSGVYVDTTSTHEFLTPEGWRPADHLSGRAGVSGTVVLAHENRLLSSQDEVVTPGGVRRDGWSDCPWNASTPYGRESFEQQILQFGRDAAERPRHAARSDGGAIGTETSPRGQSAAHDGGVACEQGGEGVAQRNVSRGMGEACDISHGHMRSVRERLPNQNNGSIALLSSELQSKGVAGSTARVESVTYVGLKPVYNMEVEAAHCFIVQGGFVVHNCRYGLASRPLKGDLLKKYPLNAHERPGADPHVILHTKDGRPPVWIGTEGEEAESGQYGYTSQLPASI
jgi:hypothetical protein